MLMYAILEFKGVAHISTSDKDMALMFLIYWWFWTLVESQLILNAVNLRFFVFEYRQIYYNLSLNIKDTCFLET